MRAPRPAGPPRPAARPIRRSPAPSLRVAGRSRSPTRWSSSWFRRAGGRRMNRSIGEEAASRSQDQRVVQEDLLVDEAAPHQRLDQLSAAEHHEILARSLLEPGHRLRSVALERRGAVPRQRSSRVVEAMYFRKSFNTAVKGLSSGWARRRRNPRTSVARTAGALPWRSLPPAMLPITSSK